MNNQSYLFITSKISRGLAALAVALQKTGVTATIASSAPDGITRTLRVPHIRMGRIKLFRKRFLIPTAAFRDFLKSDGLRVFALDAPAASLAAKMKIPAVTDPIDFGLDLTLFSPKSVSAARLQRFLTEYNIAPYQKMIVVIGKMGAGIATLLAAMKQVADPDLVIAIYGFAKRQNARKIIKQIKESGQEFRTIYIPENADLPTMLRSSYAAISIATPDRDMMMAAVAMGRPTIWGKNAFKIDATIGIRDDSNPDDVARAISDALALGNTALAEIEKKNIAAAKTFSIENTIRKLVVYS
ncbi:MAG: hypothetical protein FWC51_01290 [Proteobacteria bacterium]|nr:hypothetical protein [Pseudomonadota bacterium]